MANDDSNKRTDDLNPAFVHDDERKVEATLRPKRHTPPTR